MLKQKIKTQKENLVNNILKKGVASKDWSVIDVGVVRLPFIGTLWSYIDDNPKTWLQNNEKEEKKLKELLISFNE